MGKQTTARELPIAAPVAGRMNGGTVRITDSSLFKASKTIAAALFEVEPGCMRELHWHPKRGRMFLEIFRSDYFAYVSLA